MRLSGKHNDCPVNEKVQVKKTEDKSKTSSQQ